MSDDIRFLRAGAEAADIPAGTTPDIPDGEIVPAPARLVATPVVTIGAVTADVQFAGLTGSGLYQINVKVPEGVPDGDLSVVVQIEGARTQENAMVTVQR